VKEFWKSIHICQSYYQTSRGLLFTGHGVFPDKDRSAWTIMWADRYYDNK